MIVSVLSPVHGQAGNTTAALLISLLLAKTQNKSVCLTHLSPQSSAFYTYLGLDALEDETCSPSQVVKLLREGAISPQDMTDYCFRVCDNLDIFSNNFKSFSGEDMELTQRFILENMPHDFIVLDVDINTELSLAKLARAKTELSVISLTQSLNVTERYKEVFRDKPAQKTLFLCNNYSSDIGSVAAFAKSVGQTVLMPTVYDDQGNFNRENKRRKVKVAEPIGPYQMYTREADYGRSEAYVMTDSGRLMYWCDTDSYHYAREDLDALFAKAPAIIADALQDPGKWVDYNLAAVADRLSETEAHNNPIRDARIAQYAAEHAARVAADEELAKAREESFRLAVDGIGDALIKGERADIPRGFDKNPLLALFALYEVNVPLQTKGNQQRACRVPATTGSIVAT